MRARLSLEGRFDGCNSLVLIIIIEFCLYEASASLTFHKRIHAQPSFFARLQKSHSLLGCSINYNYNIHKCVLTLSPDVTPTDTRYHQPVSKVETIYYYCCCCCLPSTTTTTSASTRTTTVDYGGTQNTLLEPRAPFLHSSHPCRDWSPDKRRHLRPPP